MLIHISASSLFLIAYSITGLGFAPFSKQNIISSLSFVFKAIGISGSGLAPFSIQCLAMFLFLFPTATFKLL